MEQIRAFIAIELSDAVRTALGQLQSSLKSERMSFVRWVDPSGIHLTLKFLGNIATDRVPDVVGAMDEACRGIKPFELRLDGLGVFPNFSSPRVAWVGIEGEVERLLTLQAGVEQALAPLGFPAEGRPFTPHLTLGRLRDRTGRAERRRFGEIVSSMQAEDMPSFRVNAVSLMRSQLAPSGAIYSRLRSVSLEKGQ